MAQILPAHRDLLIRQWRRRVIEHTAFLPFVHQAEPMLASEGLTLTDVEISERDPLPEGGDHLHVLIACAPTDPRAIPIGDNTARVERRLVVPRTGGVAHHLTDLAAYKAGKSKGVGGVWTPGFACIPDAHIDMIGIEYKTSENEFQYLVETLLAGRKPLVPKYEHLYNDPRNGRMYLELRNGFTVEVRSWERREGLKGAQRTAYLYNECYQLPGLEAYTSVAQNLRAERGFAYFSTTCDRPWVSFLHEMGHGTDDDWHCSCGTPGWCNAYTFDQRAFVRDCPDDRELLPYLPAYPWLTPVMERVKIDRDRGVPGLMTRERFAIAWLGLLGTYAGRVYDYQRGQCQFTPTTHPGVWSKSAVDAWAAQEVVNA